MGIVTSNHRAETVHPTHDQFLNEIHIILDHNHLTIIETEIVNDDHSHEIDFVLLETILILY